MMALRFSGHRLLDQPLELLQRCATAKGSFKLHLLIAQQAGAKLSIYREAQAIAVKAKVFTERADKDYRALRTPESKVFGRTVALTGQARLQCPQEEEALMNFGCGDRL